MSRPGWRQRDEAISSLIENLDTVAGTLADARPADPDAARQPRRPRRDLQRQHRRLDAALTEFSAFSTDLSTLLDANRDEITRIIGNLDVTVAEQVVPRLDLIDQALSGLDEFGRAVFNVGSQRRVAQPDDPLLPARTRRRASPPIIPGVGAAGVSESSAGAAAGSRETGLANRTQLVVGELASGSGAPR